MMNFRFPRSLRRFARYVFEPPTRLLRAGAGVASLALACFACGCSSLLPTTTPPPAYYSLSSPQADSLPLPARSGVPGLAEGAPTLRVNPPRAAPGLDSRRILYTRQAHHLEYFAHSEWVDTPARMLAPLIQAKLERSPALRSVLSAGSTALAELNLETDIVQLQQGFDRVPSSVQFRLRATLVDSSSRQVLASGEFHARVASATDNPAGGVAAANQAVAQVLEQLASFCTEAATRWRPAPAKNGNGKRPL